MNKFFEKIGELIGLYFGEYIKDYRESNNKIFEYILQANSQINMIILTVSVASLTAVAALNKVVFIPYEVLSFITISLFIIVILLSVVNLFLSILTSEDLQKKIVKNFTSFKNQKVKNEDLKYYKTRRFLNWAVLLGFCFGLVTFLILLGLHIFGVKIA